ncbi:MAG: hypothetical protein VW268_14700 [Rhodospirillaceae bacterium]
MFMHIIESRPFAVLAAAAAGAFATDALADPGDGRYGHHMWDGGGMFMGFGMMAIMILVVVVIIVLLVKGIAGNVGANAANAVALNVLNERCARGEIDTAEYNERKNNLMTGK